MHKLLIDECLREELAKLARVNGHPESSHVRWLGKGGLKDWQLLPLILAGDWTFVTRNAIDFRGPAAEPGHRGAYARVGLHAGLICLIDPVLDLELQRDLFMAALDELARDGDLVNQVIEVAGDEDEIRIDRYALPAGGKRA